MKTVLSPYEEGKTAATACASCHGEDGNSTTPGTPSLAGQQPLYFVHALQSYLDGSRHIATMEIQLRGMKKVQMENLAVYFATQTPVQRPPPSFGDAAAGEPLSANCGGCHGAKGVSNDTATPSLAGQDAQYLVNATKSYRDGSRHHHDMNQLLTDSSDKGIENIAAFYSIQKSKAAETSALSVKSLADKCDRCHGLSVQNPKMAVPKINGQNKDYLVMALRAYRDGKRESSMMHKMSLPYSDTVIDSIATWYANQPAR
jgi:cytochrome c553